jgi:O-antigen/teichoic acid export membrane protein
MAGRRANSVYMLMGQIFGKAGLFISLMIYSRILGDDPFGELLFAVSIGLIVIFLSDMGVTMLVTRRIAAGTEVNSTLSSAVVLRSILSLVTVSAVVVTGWAAGYASRQLVLILLVSSGFVLDGFLETSFAVFRAKEVMINEGAARLLLGMLTVSLAVFALHTHRGVYFAGATYVARQIPAVVFAYFVLFRMGFRLDISHKAMKSAVSLLKAAVPLGIVGLFLVAGERLDSVFIKAELGDSAIAAYQQSTKILEALVLVVTPTLLPGALFAALCESAQVGWYKARERIAWMTELFIVIAVVLLIPLFAFEQYVLRIVWGGEFLRGIPMNELLVSFRIVLLTLPVAYIYHMFMAVVISLERQKNAVPLVAVSLAVEIVLFLVLIPVIGIAGAAVAHFALMFSVASLLALDLRRKYGATGFVRGAARPSAAAIPVFAILYMHPLSPAGNAILAMAVFVAAWLVMGGRRIIPSRQ